LTFLKRVSRDAGHAQGHLKEVAREEKELEQKAGLAREKAGEIARQLARRFGVTKVCLFGSLATDYRERKVARLKRLISLMGLLLKIRGDLAGKFFEITQFFGDGFINCPVI